eukprot:4979426-Prymnesium_polylepis.1
MERGVVCECLGVRRVVHPLADSRSAAGLASAALYSATLRAVIIGAVACRSPAWASRHLHRRPTSTPTRPGRCRSRRRPHQTRWRARHAARSSLARHRSTP